MSIDDTVKSADSLRLKDFIPIYGMYKYAARVTKNDDPEGNNINPSANEIVYGTLLSVYNIALTVAGGIGIHQLAHWLK